MAEVSHYIKHTILYLASKGWTAGYISSHLQEMYEVDLSRQSVSKFLSYYRSNKSVLRKSGSRRKTKITPEVKCIVEAKIQSDSETTATQLQQVLHISGISISLTTLKQYRRELGWTFHGSRYSHMIRELNRVKRLEWCVQQIQEKDDFEDVIWSDETSIQLDSHHRHAFRRKDQARKLTPRPKQLVKVQVWAGISKKGATAVCIFEGIMDTDFYLEILRRHLVPFIQSNFPSTHRFMQDNDSRHTSRKAKNFFESETINWWRTPPESPDLNPIENLWHELKDYIQQEVKPTTKTELIEGIKQFWTTVDTEKCRRHIGHLSKVIPRVIDCSGAASGY